MFEGHRKARKFKNDRNKREQRESFDDQGYDSSRKILSECRKNIFLDNLPNAAARIPAIPKVGTYPTGREESYA